MVRSILMPCCLLLCAAGGARAQGLTDAVKLELLKGHAPRVWLQGSEEYYPSSVEWAFQFMNRVQHEDGQWWLQTKQALSSPSDDSLRLFKGNLDTAPVYAFWVEKPQSELEAQLVSDGRTIPNVVDLVYFFFYPYNRGKEVLDTIWGNHVGDWEHVTVRLEAVGPRDDRKLVPTRMYISAHDGGGEYAWESIAKVVPNDLEQQLLDIDSTSHPVVYSAWGSHGCYRDPGDYDYKKVITTDLTDHCNQGTAWNTWLRVRAFDFNARRELGRGGWPAWLGSDFRDPGTGDPAAPPADRSSAGATGRSEALAWSTTSPARTAWRTARRVRSRRTPGGLR